MCLAKKGVKMREKGRFQCPLKGEVLKLELNVSNMYCTMVDREDIVV